MPPRYFNRCRTVSRSFLTIVLLELLTCGGSLPAYAGELERVLEDSKAYITAPLHWDSHDWAWFATAAAATALATTADESVRDHFAPAASATGPRSSHELRDAAPIALLAVGTYLASRWSDNQHLRRTSYDMVEAAGLAMFSSGALKFVTGRQRPYVTPQSNQWFKNGDAFPSGHVAVAFAAATVFAERDPDPTFARRALAYGLATATAYARIDGNSHWLSDAVAGAALGIATGRFVLHRESRRTAMQIGVIPTNGGAIITWTFQPNE